MKKGNTVVVILMRIISVIAILIALILFVMHFTIELDAFWFSIPLAVGVLTNLIASILYLKGKRKKENNDDNENII